MTPIFMLLWISTEYVCPWGFGRSPIFIKEILCEKSQGIEYRIETDEARLAQKLRDLGPTTTQQVVEIAYGKARPLRVDWAPDVRR